MLRIVNETERASIYLYGTIGEDFWGDGNSAKDFAERLDGFGGKPLDIHIDSPGGDVYEGFAMCSAIQRYQGDTTAHVEGMAASAASYVAAVCDVVKIYEYAFFMIHNAWTCAYGNATALLDVAERLEGIDETIAAIYSKRTGLPGDDIAQMMAAETWFTADEALAAGFATEVVETEERVAAAIDPAIARLFAHLPDTVRVSAANADGTEPASGDKAPSAGCAAETIESGERKDEPFCLLNGKVVKGQNHAL